MLHPLARAVAASSAALRARHLPRSRDRNRLSVPVGRNRRPLRAPLRSALPRAIPLNAESPSRIAYSARHVADEAGEAPAFPAVPSQSTFGIHLQRPAQVASSRLAACRNRPYARRWHLGCLLYTSDAADDLLCV